MNDASPHILVISPNWIGDALMAQPLLQQLRKKYPQSSIDVLAPAWVAPVWEAMCEVTHVIATPFKHGKLQLSQRWKLAKNLEKDHYDQAYVLPNTLKYALIPWFAHIPQRIGYVGEKRYGLINVLHHDDKKAPRAMIPFYAALAEDPSVPVKTRTQYPAPAMQMNEQSVRDLWQRMQWHMEDKIIAFAPGAEFGPAKRWPQQSFAQLAQQLMQYDAKLRIVLMGSAKDDEICQEIKRSTPEVINLAGKTSLREAIALLSHVSLLVTNDSGLMHIASAFQRPVVAIYGSTDYLHTPPCSSHATIVSLDLPCAPCQQRQCPLKHHKCMRDLTAQRVFDACLPYLKKPIGFSPIVKAE